MTTETDIFAAAGTFVNAVLVKRYRLHPLDYLQSEIEDVCTDFQHIPPGAEFVLDEEAERSELDADQLDEAVNNVVAEAGMLADDGAIGVLDGDGSGYDEDEDETDYQDVNWEKVKENIQGAMHMFEQQFMILRNAALSGRATVDAYTMEVACYNLASFIGRDMYLTSDKLLECVYMKENVRQHKSYIGDHMDELSDHNQIDTDLPPEKLEQDAAGVLGLDPNALPDYRVRLFEIEEEMKPLRRKQHMLAEIAGLFNDTIGMAIGLSIDSDGHVTQRGA